jgi:cytochrome c-type biogenesis protein CcmH/NrfG
VVVAIFWIITILLVFCALGFILPWIKSIRYKILVSALLSVTTYGLYLQWGSSEYLPNYYSSDEQSQRAKQTHFRKLLAEFRKQEFRLRLKLEEDPTDLDAEWRLLDLLAVKAVQSGEYAQAVQHWQAVLLKIPKDVKYNAIRTRISNFIKTYKKYK